MAATIKVRASRLAGARHRRFPAPVAVAVALVLAVLLVLPVAACSSPGGAASSGSAKPSRAVSTQMLTVTSTLDGHATLPLRIHWQAFASGPAADVSEVDFLIDGRLG